MTPETLSPGTIVILIGAAVAILAILTLALTRKLGAFLLLAGGVAAVVIVAQAMRGQAQATQETALAAQEAAQAATAATVGQTVTSFALVALAGLLALVAILAIVVVIYFWLRIRRAETMERSGNWKSGPNALWGRDPLPQTPGIEMMLPMLMQQMAIMQAMMMSTFQHGTPPAVPHPQRESSTPLLLPEQYVVDDGDTNVPANWGWGDWQV
ncbi:MAG: hypothetical protein GY832_05575 [Chloroflexi bacterium]|nr:hypothetical protein [Chloroflexota bacterium]